MPKTSKPKESSTLNLVKKFIKNNDPENIKKRKFYSQKPDVREHRKKLNSKRRLIQSTLIPLIINNGGLLDKFGNSYEIINNYLVKKNTVPGVENQENPNNVIVYNRKTKSFISFPFKKDEDLMDPEFNINLPKEDNSKLICAVKDLLEGKNQEIEEFVKSKKVLTQAEMQPEECYWKKLSSEEQMKLLKKIEGLEKSRDSTIIV